MVEVNTKLIIFGIMINAFLLGMFAIMPADITTSFDGVKAIDPDGDQDYSDRLPNDNLNGTEIGMSDAVDSSWSLIGRFFMFMITGGAIGVTGIPIYISIPLAILLWSINIMLLLELIGYVRELIGFT